jgi:hypothetical protein
LFEIIELGSKNNIDAGLYSNNVSVGGDFMNIDKIIKKTRRLETLLRLHYHAEGKGLHQLVSSCEERLPHDVIKKLRFIATVRNKTVHEDGFTLDDARAFDKACRECLRELTPRSGRFIWRLIIVIMTLITLSALGFYYRHWEQLSQQVFQ